MNWFVDIEGGNDNTGGDSFTATASNTDGAMTLAGVFTTTAGGFTALQAAEVAAGRTLVGRAISIFNTGTTYNNYQITAVTNDTTLQLAAWTGSGITGTALVALATNNRQWYIGGRWKNPNISGQPNGMQPVMAGDTVRLMASPAPVSTTLSGKWTDTDTSTAKFFGPVTANGYTISTIVSGAPMTINTTGAHGLSTGEWVGMSGFTVNTGLNNLWRVTVTSSTQFTLDGSTATGSSSITGGAFLPYTNRVVEVTDTTWFQIIDRVISTSLWTGANGTTVAASSAMFKDLGQGQLFTPSGTPTGKLAFKATGTLNLSAFQQVSLFLKMNVASFPSGQFSIKLCSDTTGDIVVHSIPIPAVTSTVIFPLLWDNGSALSSSIQSIAIYRDSGTFALTSFNLSNIVAVVANSNAKAINHTSLIGKVNSVGAGGTDAEAWFPVQCIYNNGSGGAAIAIDNDVACLPVTATNSSMPRGYTGVTATATIYRRETIKPFNVLAVITNYISGGQLRSGTGKSSRGTGVNISGGWNRTDMTTQQTPAQTYVDGQGQGSAVGVIVNQIAGVTVSGISLVRMSTAVSHSQCTGATITVEECVGCGITLSISNGIFNSAYTFNFMNNGNGLAIPSGSPLVEDSVFKFTLIAGQSYSTPSLSVVGKGQVIGGVIRNNPQGIGTGFGGKLINVDFCEMFSITNAQNQWVSPLGVTAADNEMFMVNPIFRNGPGKVFPDLVVGASAFQNINVHMQNLTLAGVAMGNVTMFDGGAVADNAVTFRSGKSRKVTLYNTLTAAGVNRASTYPYPYCIAKVYCKSGQSVTVTVWVNRETLNLGMALFCPTQYGGPGTDQTATAVAAINTWEQLSLTITPTDDVVVKFYVNCWYATPGAFDIAGYIDDVAITGTAKTDADANSLDYYNNGRLLYPAFQPAAAGLGGMKAYVG
jgi:hypothetical protein